MQRVARCQPSCVAGLLQCPRVDGLGIVVNSRRMRSRYAIVGTGARAEMFVRAIAGSHADTSLVAFADVNQVRMDAHNRLLTSLGAAEVATYRPDQFGLMLDKEQVDVVLVTSVDRTHDEYIVAALDAGRDVITE